MNSLGISIRKRGLSQLALREAYFDDSGKESDQHHRFVLLAGYLSPPQGWDAFNVRWEMVLRRHEIPVFHLKDIRGLGRKRGWDERQTEAVITEFADVIVTSDLTGFGMAIDAKQWKAIPRHVKRVKTCHEFAMLRIMRMLVDYLDEMGLDDHIQTVFDQDEEFSGGRLSRYFGVRRMDPVAKRSLAIISFADAAKCYPLQAADLFVGEVRRWLIERETGGVPTPQFEMLSKARSGYRYFWEDFAGPGLRETLEAHVREVMATLKDVSASGP